jgi:TatD DNase family protein
MILIGIDPQSWAATARMCADSLPLWRTAGLHPNSVPELWDANLEAALREEAAGGDLVAIGETGVDLYRSSDSRELQMEAFDAQLHLAQEFALPIVIHQRDAQSEVLEVLARHGEVRGVMHCFGGDWDFAQECLRAGLHLGIGGVATFRNSHETRDALRKAPLDRLLLETDAPFLAPQSVRGRRNEPAYLRHVVDTLAATRTESESEIEAATTRNAATLFGLVL